MKIDGITLLTMIRDGKIKKGTKIHCSDFVESYYFDGETLYLKSTNYKLSLKDMLENLNYATYEIIEEKPKKINKIIIPNDWNESRELTSEELRKAYKHNFEIIFRNANEIIDAVNYLLEKSDSE